MILLLALLYTLFTGGIPNPWTVITAEGNFIHLSEKNTPAQQIVLRNRNKSQIYLMNTQLFIVRYHFFR
jgi:hypothetical protein